MTGAERRARLAAARLYLCTPIRRDLATFAEAVLAAGVDVVQLRDKAERHGALLAVNDRADVALAAGADICHLGQGDLPLDWARRILGAEVLLGRSTHTLEQASRACEEDWDYLAVGPVHATPTKPGRRPVGAGLLAEVVALDPPRPWFAIGGIDLGNLDEVLAAGATRVVVVRAIADAPDPAEATAALATRLRKTASAGQRPGPSGA